MIPRVGGGCKSLDPLYMWPAADMLSKMLATAHDICFQECQGIVVTPMTKLCLTIRHRRSPPSRITWGNFIVHPLY